MGNSRKKKAPKSKKQKLKVNKKAKKSGETEETLTEIIIKVSLSMAEYNILCFSLVFVCFT